MCSMMGGAMNEGMDDTLESDSVPRASDRIPLARAVTGDSVPTPSWGSGGRSALDLAETRDSGELGAVVEASASGRQDARSRQTDERVGRYITLSRLGSGGMGVVLAAYDPELDRKVALKLLRTQGKASPQAQLRLQREAQALAKLSHRNVVSVHDVGVHEGQIFVAMEFVDGETLYDWMHAVDSPRPWREVLDVLLEAGHGLAAAHAEGLVHRDFKPDNVMLGRDGSVKVMDFGIARASEEIEELMTRGTRVETGPMFAALRSPIGRLTRDGTVIGTPAYMSHEQLLGAEVDARSDQFSFCVTLYEALYGAPPFSGETLNELMASIRGGAPREPSGAPRVPGWLRQAILRGLASEPEERWPSMEALLLVLSEDPVRRRRWVMTAVLVALLGAVAVAAGILWSAEERPCKGMEAQLQGVWDGERRRAVKEALLGTEVSYAPETWSIVARRLGDYTDGWVRAREGICESTRAGEQSARLLDLRMACLDERLHYVQATVDELTRVDERTVADAVQVIAKLPGLGACARAEVLAEEPLLPADPAIAAEVSALNRALITARAKTSAGRFDEALALAEEVVDGATALDYEPLLARAWLLRGAAHERSGHYDDAVADLERALESALALNMREESADAANELVYVVGYERAEVEAAQRWIPLARALSRAAESRRSQIRYLTHAGTVAYVGGMYEEARSLWEEALELVQRAPTLDQLDLSPILANLGALARHQGRYAAAREYQAQVLAITESELGPEHPEMAEALSDLGAVEISAGSPSEAREPIERAVALATKALGPDHPGLIYSLANLGELALLTGDAKGGLRDLRRAQRIAETSLGADDPLAAKLSTSLGRTLLELGDPAALGHLERALKVQSEGEVGEVELAETRFALARALWELPPESGRDRRRAVAVAKLALPAWEGDGERSSAKLRELRAWLMEHARPDG